MPFLLGHLLLVLAACALADVGLRAATALGAAGLDRVVAAAPVAASVAALSALALSLVGLGGSPVALGCAAAAVWGLARWRLPVADFWSSLAGGWRDLSRRERIALGAAFGAALAWLAWLARHPALNNDPLTYHLPEAIRWVQTGHPGAVDEIVYEFPVGAYPLVNEVLVAWGTALSGSLAWALGWTALCGLLFAVAVWSALRRSGVGPRVAALCLGALLLIPIVVTQFLGPHTDIPALTWLLCCAALSLAAVRSPALLVPAVLAFGLAVGTKTTVAPLGLAALALGAWGASGRTLRPRAVLDALRPHAAALGAAVAAAAVLGGFWYLRNWVDHGSPLWPFLKLPGGDEVPAVMQSVDTSFLDAPSKTLGGGRSTLYVEILAGSLLVLALGLLAPLFSRRRQVLAASGAALLSLLLWMQAPYTGAASDPVLDISLTTVRYLLPGICAATLAVALAARDTGGLPRAIAVGTLGVAVAFNLLESQRLTFPGMPSLALLVAGAVFGAGAALAVRYIPRPPSLVLALGGGLAAVVALTVVADGLVRRQGGIDRYASGGVVSWLAAQDAFDDEEFPIASAPFMIAVLAGDRLQHDIELIPRDEPCAAVRARARRGLVVIGTAPFADKRAAFTAGACLRSARPLFADRSYRVYGVLAR